MRIGNLDCGCDARRETLEASRLGITEAIMGAAVIILLLLAWKVGNVQKPSG